MSALRRLTFVVLSSALCIGAVALAQPVDPAAEAVTLDAIRFLAQSHIAVQIASVLVSFSTLLVAVCSLTANFVSPTSRIGAFIHAVALNGPGVRQKVIDAVKSGGLLPLLLVSALALSGCVTIKPSFVSGAPVGSVVGLSYARSGSGWKAVPYAGTAGTAAMGIGLFPDTAGPRVQVLGGAALTLGSSSALAPEALALARITASVHAGFVASFDAWNFQANNATGFLTPFSSLANLHVGAGCVWIF